MLPKRFLLVVLTLLGCGIASHGQAPTGPPPGGYQPTVVTTLARVPPPPGSLIPYRKGNLWGYADTTGRVIVAPVLLEEPRIITEREAFVPIPLTSVPFFLEPGAAEPAKRLKKEVANKEAIMNARGEVLLKLYFTQTLLLPNGSLLEGSAKPHPGELILKPYSPPFQPARSFNWQTKNWDTVRVPLHPPHRRWLGQALGPNRYAYSFRRSPFWALSRLAKHRPHRLHRFWKELNSSGGIVLTDSTTHRVSRVKYIDISPFHENRAQAWLRHTRLVGRGPQRQAQRWVYLDRQGHEMVQVPPETTDATDFEGGTALLWVKRRIDYYPSYTRTGGIIDSLGRVLVPLTSALSNPDEDGLLRLREAAGADSVTHFITRQGQPAFPHKVFRRAGPFYNGRAWAESLDGRQGLLNRRGEWVTLAAYDLLGSATERYFIPHSGEAATYRHDNPQVSSYAWSREEENRQPADTAYMLVRRAGHYGWVSRHTGYEVIPARYDSVIFHLTGGVACAVRNGRRYVITAQGRELVQATYRGDWYDYPGRPLHLFRPAEGRWSVMDTSGRFRLPWLPGTGFLTPEGRAVVEEAEIAGQEDLSYMSGQREHPCKGVVAANGRVVIPFDIGVRYSGSYTSLHLASILAGYPLPFYLNKEEVSQAPSQVYRVVHPGGYQLLAAANFQPFTPGLFHKVSLLANGWHVGYRAVDSLAVLIDPAGRQITAPRGVRWERYYQNGRAENQTQPFIHGIERVYYGELGGPDTPLPYHPHYGYLTRGGRQLWAE